jgi:RimJ/RimL family protein N-acetyltransferase
MGATSFSSSASSADPAPGVTPALPLLDPSRVTPLLGERVGVRLVERADLAALLQVHGSDEVTRYLPYVTWRELADAERWYERAMSRHEARSALQFVVVDRAAERVVGTCLLFNPNEDSARAELGYSLGRADWGRGLMGEALTLLLDASFGAFGVRRLEAEVDPRNVASHRLLLRLGFTHEGLRRRRTVMKGEEKDSNVYGLLADEWRAGRR